MIEIDENLVYHAFSHFVATDDANAAIHCADVKFSPITFRLAEALQQDPYYFDHIDVARVLVHKGKYEEDKGR